MEQYYTKSEIDEKFDNIESFQTQLMGRLYAAGLEGGRKRNRKRKTKKRNRKGRRTRKRRKSRKRRRTRRKRR